MRYAAEACCALPKKPETLPVGMKFFTGFANQRGSRRTSRMPGANSARLWNGRNNGVEHARNWKLASA
jgi:hypothetical protein